MLVGMESVDKQPFEAFVLYMCWHCSLFRYFLKNLRGGEGQGVCTIPPLPKHLNISNPLTQRIPGVTNLKLCVVLLALHALQTVQHLHIYMQKVGVPPLHHEPRLASE
jgi:hypothetical protein